MWVQGSNGSANRPEPISQVIKSIANDHREKDGLHAKRFRQAQDESAFEHSTGSFILSSPKNNITFVEPVICKPNSAFHYAQS